MTWALKLEQTSNMHRTIWALRILILVNIPAVYPPWWQAECGQKRRERISFYSLTFNPVPWCNEAAWTVCRCQDSSGTGCQYFWEVKCFLPVVFGSSKTVTFLWLFFLINLVCRSENKWQFSISGFNGLHQIKFSLRCFGQTKPMFSHYLNKSIRGLQLCWLMCSACGLV